ncbi:MAG: hypothetical protein JWM89_3936 [Acidimicrobiales bacterium]|nr:hypothetical protein [Acidimicrobiales bacterium]
MVEGSAPGEQASSAIDSASEVTSGRLLRNTLVNGLANASNALVTLALTPFLLHRLGAQEYGLWVLGLSLTFSNGYLAIADIGLPEAAVKFIAEARAKGSVQVISEVASTTIAVFAVAGLVIGLAIAALAPALVSLFGVKAEVAQTAKVLFALMALEILVELPVTAARTVIEGLQRYTWLRSLDVAGRVGWGVLAVIAIRGGHGVVSLAVTTLIVTVVRAAATFVVAHRVQPGLHLRPSLATRATLRRTLGYGSFVGGLRLLSVVYAQMDRAIIGIVISVTAVASYEVIFRVQSLTTLALVMASSAVLPAAAYNAARSDHQRQRELYLRGTKYAMAIVLPVCIAALLFAKLLIVTWVGAPYGKEALSARLFVLFPILSSTNQVGVAMLIGLGRVKRVLALQLLAVGINLLVSVALAKPLGIEGVVLGTLIGGTVTWVPYLRTLLEVFAVDLRSWLRRVVYPNVPGAVAQAAVGLATLRWLSGVDQLWEVLGLFGLSCAVNLGVFALLGMGGEERRHLTSRLVGRTGPSPTTVRLP